jgi:hypothetical protein
MKTKAKTKTKAARIQRILSTSNYKIEKGLSAGINSAIVHFSPHKKSGFNVCPKATNGCINPCLDTSGLGQTSTTQAARIKKTRRYFEDRENFLNQLQKEIESFIRSSSRKGLKPAFRLNGTSDLPAFAINAARNNPGAQFYDYSKIIETLRRHDLPKNYDLTFSLAESNYLEALEALRLGFRVAGVVDPALTDQQLRKILALPNNIKIIDGDTDDLTFKKPKNAFLRLKPKGKAKWDFSGFVIWHPETIKEKIKILKARADRSKAPEAKKSLFAASAYLTLENIRRA